MQSDFIRHNVFPTLAAFIWGIAFVAQSVAAESVQAFTFNAARSAVAFLFLLMLCVCIRSWRQHKDDIVPSGSAYRKDLFLGGVCCGLALATATYLQQKGLETTTAGKAGFITALYIVLVPVCGLFLHKKVRGLVWLSVALAVCGLYFLCINGGFTISSGDFMVLLCAFCFTGHILLIDYFTVRVDGIQLSCAQFFVMMLFSSVGMLLTETPSWETLLPAMGSILYVGILSSGVAYTLQILAQKGCNPTTVSLLLSLEAVFATLAGAIILHDHMTGREYFGCIMMFAAVMLAQLPAKSKSEKLVLTAKSEL